MCSSGSGAPSSPCPLSLSAVSHACRVGAKTINVLFVGSQDSPWKKKSATIKVVKLKLNYWLREMSKRTVRTSLVPGYVKSGQAKFWRHSSRHSDNKSLLYLKHTHIQISNLVLWEDAAKMTASVFSNLAKVPVPSPFKRICSQIFSQVCKKGFTHWENTCSQQQNTTTKFADCGTNLKHTSTQHKVWTFLSQLCACSLFCSQVWFSVSVSSVWLMDR